MKKKYFNRIKYIAKVTQLIKEEKYCDNCMFGTDLDKNGYITCLDMGKKPSLILPKTAGTCPKWRDYKEETWEITWKKERKKSTYWSI